jgi:hypothetical protein
MLIIVLLELLLLLLLFADDNVIDWEAKNAREASIS